MNTKSKGKVTIINIIALLGFAMLGFFSFMGAMFFSSGSIGTSIAIAAGAVIITSLLLSAAIYCKGVESNFNKWKKVEIVMVILFWAFAALPARYVIHCFETIAEKDNLQKTADADVASLDRMFDDYEIFERNAMAITQAGLENALGQPADQNVTEYFRSASINNSDDISAWMAIERGILTGDRGTDGFSYIPYREKADSIINEWHDRIKAWDIMFVATHGADLVPISEQIAADLSENSQRGKLPVIEFVDGTYRMSRPTQFKTIVAPVLSLDKATDEFRGSDILYYIIYLAIMALIFLDYLMAYRSSRLDLRNVSQDNALSGGNRL